MSREFYQAGGNYTSGSRAGFERGSFYAKAFADLARAQEQVTLNSFAQSQRLLSDWPPEPTETQLRLLEIKKKNQANLAAWRERWEEYHSRLGQEVDLLNADAKGYLVPPPKVHVCRDCGDVEVREHLGQCRGCYRLFDGGGGATMSRGTAGGRIAGLIVKARGGFYVSGKRESPEQQRIRKEAMLGAQAILRKAGIEWNKGEKK